MGSTSATLPRAAEIGYWVRSDRHNRGYATTAVGALTDAAFGGLADLERIEIHMDRANVASARVPEKLGYRFVRTERRDRLAVAHTGQGYVLERTRHDWALGVGSLLTNLRSRCAPDRSRPSATSAKIDAVSSSAETVVGVAGLGVLGGAIANRLAARGRAVIGFDPDAAAADAGRGRTRGLDRSNWRPALTSCCWHSRTRGHSSRSSTNSSQPTPTASSWPTSARSPLRRRRKHSDG